MNSAACVSKDLSGIAAIYRRSTFRLVRLGIFCLWLCPAISNAQQDGKEESKIRSEINEKEKTISYLKKKLNDSIQLQEKFLSQSQSQENVEAARITQETIATYERMIEKHQATIKALQAKLQKTPCDSIRKQLNRDIQAIERIQKSIQLARGELEEWTKANEEAQEAAMKLGIETFLGQIGPRLAKKKNSARSFKGWITRHKKAMDKSGANLAQIKTKLEHAQSGYEKAKLLATTGKLANGYNKIADPISTAETLWETYKAETTLIAKYTQESDTIIKDLVNDPWFKENIEVEHSELELLKTILDESPLGSTPHYKMANLLVEYKYDHKKFSESKQRILQNYNLTDDYLKAMKKLDEQIKKTVKKMKASKCSFEGVSKNVENFDATGNGK